MMKTPDSLNRPTRILEAAARLITHYGFDKTTMEDIAREAGVSKGALYLEWSSKDQLFDALLAHEMKRFLLDFQARMERDPEGGRIANLYRHALLALQANPLMSALYTGDSRVLGDFVQRHAADARVERYTSRLMFGKTAVEQMQAAGLLRADIRPEVITYLLSIIALGFMSIETIIPLADVPPLEDVAAAVTSLVQHGIAGEAGDSAAGKRAMAEMVQFLLKQYGERDQGDL